MAQVIGWKVIQKLGLLKAYLKVWIEGFFGKVGEKKNHMVANRRRKKKKANHIYLCGAWLYFRELVSNLCGNFKVL